MAQKRRNNRKWLWWGGGLVVVILVIVGVVIGVNNTGSKDNEIQNSSSDSSVEKQEITQDEQKDEKKFAEEEVEKKKVVQYEGEDSNMADELSGVVTYAEVVNGNLMIRVSIDQYLTEGTCELNLVREGNVVYNSKVDIMGDATTAICKGFDVPVAEVGDGDVEININLSASNKSGIIRGKVSV